MRKPDGTRMTLIEQHMNVCRHFTGTWGNTHCAAGVEYAKFETMEGKGLARWPCRASNSSPNHCEHCSYHTQEEAEAREKRYEESFRKTLIARKAIIKHCGNKRSVSGSLPCPACNAGTLQYSRAFNGPVHAACSTPGCVRWME